MKLSPTQQTLLAKLCATTGIIRRWPGGFWVPEGTPAKYTNLDALPVHAYHQHGNVPVYYVGVGTVRALEKLGLLERFTGDGLAYADPYRLTEKARIMHCLQEEETARSREGSASFAVTRALDGRRQREGANPPGLAAKKEIIKIDNPGFNEQGQVIDLMAVLKASLAKKDRRQVWVRGEHQVETDVPEQRTAPRRHR